MSSGTKEKKQNSNYEEQKLRHKICKGRRYSDYDDSDQWVEKTQVPEKQKSDRDGWMSMTGMLKTYTKDDFRIKKDDKAKRQLDSYDPSTSSRELNPYWKDGGTGTPRTSEELRNSRPFIKPDNKDDYYSRSKQNKSSSYSSEHYELNKCSERSDYSSTIVDKEHSGSSSYVKYGSRNIQTWKKSSRDHVENSTDNQLISQETSRGLDPSINRSDENHPHSSANSGYLSVEKMNKLAAKIVKAEIMGNMDLVAQLKLKLEAAREYRQNHPEAEEDQAVMLISTNSAGNSRPLVKNLEDLQRSGKRKAETHKSGNRIKYFADDDKYNLSQMFQEEKYGRNDDDDAQFANIVSKQKNPNDDLEDIFVEELSKNRNSVKDSEKEKQRAIKQHVKMEKSLEGCEYCIGSKNMLKHLMVSCKNKVYLSLPAKKSLVKGHCILTTVQHFTCVTSLDEDVWEEIMNYRKALVQLYNSQNKDVVFFETATKLHRFPHVVVNCIPLPRDVGDVAAIYFKKALLECEAEWSMNKKLIELKGKNIRKGVPKGLPYFWIDFGMEPGYAHVIEDQQLFPKNFAEEVIGGILDLDHNLWKNPQREYGDLQRKKVSEFVKEWKKFDIM